VTTRFPLADAADAFETLVKGKDAQGNMVLKIVSLVIVRRIRPLTDPATGTDGWDLLDCVRPVPLGSVRVIHGVIHGSI
jgi:hypothetical protein